MSQQELITIPPQTALQVFTTEGATDPLLAKVRARIDEFAPDAATPKGRQEIKSFAFAIVKTKTALESVGKALADEQKAIPKKIDECRRTFRETLDRWHDEVRKPLTDWEEAERARVARHTDEIARIDQVPSAAVTAAEIRECLAEIEAIVISPDLEEFEANYARAKDSAIRALRLKLVERERWEAEQAELARLRREADEQAARDREERIRVEAVVAERARAEREAAAERAMVEREAAAEKARVAAEAARVEAEARAARDAAERREQDQRLAAEAAERRAAETELRLKREAEAEAARVAAEKERREADIRRRNRVKREAVAALVAGGVDEEVARSVIVIIARKAVPHVSIAY